MSIQFNDTTPGGMSTAQLGALSRAALVWEQQLADPVTVYIDVNFATFSQPSTLADTRSALQVISYADARAQLAADASTAADATAVSHLQASDALSFMSSNLDGSSRLDNDLWNSQCASSGPCDANNRFLSLSTANAKALGLATTTSATNADASITFGAGIDWSYTLPGSSAAAATGYDFTTIAAHEIGHALGFNSGVQYLDDCLTDPDTCGYTGIYDTEAYAVFSVFDLFRYSAPGVMDERVGVPAYFSIDAGLTALASLCTGSFAGDGWQPSHFAFLSPLLMRPTFEAGESVDPGVPDLIAYDVIGWDAISPVPEPSTTALTAFGLLALLAWRGRSARRRQAPASTAHAA